MSLEILKVQMRQMGICLEVSQASCSTQVGLCARETRDPQGEYLKGIWEGCWFRICPVSLGLSWYRSLTLNCNWISLQTSVAPHFLPVESAFEVSWYLSLPLGLLDGFLCF